MENKQKIAFSGKVVDYFCRISLVFFAFFRSFAARNQKQQQ